MPGSIINAKLECNRKSKRRANHYKPCVCVLSSCSSLEWQIRRCEKYNWLIKRLNKKFESENFEPWFTNSEAIRHPFLNVYKISYVWDTRTVPLYGFVYKREVKKHICDQEAFRREMKETRNITWLSRSQLYIYVHCLTFFLTFEWEKSQKIDVIFKVNDNEKDTQWPKKIYYITIIIGCQTTVWSTCWSCESQKFVVIKTYSQRTSIIVMNNPSSFHYKNQKDTDY